MAAPKSDMLVSTIEKCIKEYNDLQAQSKVVVAEAKLAQALDIVSRIPLDQSQYELVQVGFILRVLSESGYATKVNQLVQEWEIQCAGAPPSPIGFGEPSKAPVVPAGRLLKFVPELVRNKKICRAPPAIGFGKSGKAYFELPGSLKYINEGRIRFKQKMPVFQDGKPIGAPPAVEEFLNKAMKLFQDGIIVFLDGELVFRDGKPIECKKHGAPPVIGFGESGKAPVVPARHLLKSVLEPVRDRKTSFGIAEQLKYVNEGRIIYRRKMPEFQDGKPVGAPPAIGFGESGKAHVVPAGHLLKSVPQPVRDRKTSFGIAGRLKFVNEGRIIYQRKMPEFQDGKPVGAPPGVGEFLTEHMKLFQDGIIVFLDGELVFRDGKPVRCEKHGTPSTIGFGESSKAHVVPAGHLLKSVPQPVRDRKTSFGIAGQLKFVNEGRIIYQRKMPEFQDRKPIGAPPGVGEFLTEHMKLFQDGIIVFLDGELVFRDGKPIRCEKHGTPPAIGFGEFDEAPFDLAERLKLVQIGKREAPPATEVGGGKRGRSSV